jgi:hypothetical protein
MPLLLLLLLLLPPYDSVLGTEAGRLSRVTLGMNQFGEGAKHEFSREQWYEAQSAALTRRGIKVRCRDGSCVSGSG